MEIAHNVYRGDDWIYVYFFAIVTRVLLLTIEEYYKIGSQENIKVLSVGSFNRIREHLEQQLMPLLIVIDKILEEHPIGMINVESLMKNSVSGIRALLDEFKADLIPQEDEI